MRRNQGKIVFKGTGFNSIRHFKNEVESIEEGKECGIQIKGFTDFKEGDVIETYEYRDVRQPLS
ncbi:uncharacterized protein [Blastocystis hominis]|uniref:Translation elongation factor EFTu-like domain-containing protein n=1 Tax=Blastocystis hominis TaxID=12968 RepID=D8LZT7_BLAHO|nr:uncharacterized protein [Blastocystis hominis]CBK21326.2 unnamed protein product [Blastocystis hominis]|eukprot:XP_012895374.1 uncharacterized protein [Blastocystis hominis]